MQDVIDWIAGRDWPEVVKTLAPLATAVIAFVALRNWQRQDKAKREAEFLDEIIEATHTYIAEMSKPIALMKMAKIAMAAHMPIGDVDDDAHKALKGAIAYIQKHGKEESNRLSLALDAVQPSTIRLRSLAAKGQVFDFAAYRKCQSAVATLTWQFDRLEAFMGMLGWPTANWDHPEVLKSLQSAVAIDGDELEQALTNNNIAVIEFVRQTYKRIYGQE